MTILPFQSLTRVQLDRALAIYRDAFDAPWEWPVEKIARLAEIKTDGTPWYAAALLDGDAVVAMAVAKYFSESNLWYLHYLAVDAGRRGQGTGSRLLDDALRAGEVHARGTGLPGVRGTLIEVETVDGPPPGADRRVREQRHAFYRRFGAQATGVIVPRPPWVAPEQPDWDIMFVPGAAWTGELDAPTRREFCRALMVEGYGFSPDAPWLAEYLGRIAA